MNGQKDEVDTLVLVVLHDSKILGLDVVEAKVNEEDNLDDPIVSKILSDLEIEGFNVISIVVKDKGYFS